MDRGIPPEEMNLRNTENLNHMRIAKRFMFQRIAIPLRNTSPCQDKLQTIKKAPENRGFL
jgi:hypothetical protein